jgi:hypothetical protein
MHAHRWTWYMISVPSGGLEPKCNEHVWCTQIHRQHQFKTFWRSENFSGGCCLAESRYQTSVNFIQTYTVHILLNYHTGIGANHFDRDTTICLYIKAENKFLQLLPFPTWATMDCVFHVYMQQEYKAMVMTLYMTVVKQHSQHIMIPTIIIYMTIVKQLTLTTKYKTV